MSVEREQIERSDSKGISLVFYNATQGSSNAATAKGRADQHSAEPRHEILTTFKVVRAKGGHSKDLILRVCDPGDRQDITVEVSLELGCADGGGVFRQNEAPLLN
ncbi:MAG: hypothetical protein M3361_17190 [Candidatus Tectomicrobia bacterium]|nr:hypothetical protein [Candidatus Tectomicrobia bacterium]